MGGEVTESEVTAGEAAPAKPRYSQHRLLRAYARALLEKHGELEAAAARHFEHYYRLHGDFEANNDEDRHTLITPDFENLQQALAWGFENSAEKAVDLALALGYYMQMRETLDTRREVLQKAQTSAEAAGYVLGLANTLKALGDLSVRQAELDAARAFYDRALPLYEQIGARVGQLNMLRQYAQLEIQIGNTDRAQDYYRRCLALADTIPAYRNHPVVQGWRREYQKLVDGGGEPTEEEQAAEAMRMLARVYRQGGADAVRQMLRGQVPEEVIEQLVALLAQAGGMTPKRESVSTSP
ncbi:MAG: tetratricopeptide repeat protein [Chloroflexi bacterium]|nr:tetratricopeptide repeat protein [Chloroflexota bacterium]MDL1885553.1 tetratricopeptide repeat protein [Anaerolineae bacterium CFX8]